MELNDIFNIDQYTQAYDFVKDNPELTITDIGNGKYQITKIQNQSIAERSAILRNERNFLLQETDKYMIPDYPITEEERQKYVEYRRYLRNIPQDKKFPEIEIKTYNDFIS